MENGSKKFEIQPDELAMPCYKDLPEFSKSSELEPLNAIIGQERAEEAIHFGLNMKGSGYHIFVTGLDGTGRSSIVRELLQSHAETRDIPEDLCLVNNFQDEYRPQAIEMPAGTAHQLSKGMTQFIEVLKARVPQIFESPGFREAQEKIRQHHSRVQSDLFDTARASARQQELDIVRTEEGYEVIPVSADGQPMSQSDFDALEDSRRQALKSAVMAVESQLSDAVLEIDKSSNEMDSAIKDLVARETGVLINQQIGPLKKRFKGCTQVLEYLKAVKEDIIENIALFIGAAEGKEPKENTMMQMTGTLAKRYQVNVLVDHREEKGAPVVFEANPSFGNLFGKIEKQPVMGSFTTDFTMVQAGSLLKANKGYLMINIEPLLLNAQVWELLKQTLQDASLQIEDMPDQADYGMPSLKPAPIPLDVRVILIGGYEPFRILQGLDARFNKIFKVRADFDYETWRTPESVAAYARFIARVCQTEDLLEFTRDGVWQVLEYGSRLAENRGKLTLRLGVISSLLKEADFWARKAGAEVIDKTFVRQAVSRHRFRHNLYEEKVMEEFDDHSVLLDVSGSVEGQVNALAVYDMGEIAFGRPTRITAESYMGNPGIINVEHESDLSGETHDKGVMIVSGYLGRMFAQNYPLSVSISITFEQSYDGVDGDSASSSELYAVLSSLSGIPIRQDVAVTGSVNQKGEIQAIGGVNEKIEGFFDICVRKGLTGTQGVMIPASNVRHLVLRNDVAEAVKEKKFYLYSIHTIEDGIEVLTGMPAGSCDEEFNYEPGTVFGEVQNKLARYHKLSVQ